MPRFLTPPAPPTRLSAPPARGRVLVIAPHPDDETIGCGATLALHAELHDPIHVVFLTAGTSGDPTGTEDKAAYAALREREARAAAAVLGITTLEFWGHPDNFQVNENDLRTIEPRVDDLFARVRPDVVYAPHLGDQHSDHYVAAVLVKRALARSRSTARAFGFEVWSAHAATWVVDVSRVYATKMKALACYASQLRHTDIASFVSGLNAYRAVFLEKGAKYGEAFVALEPDAHAGLP